MKKLPIKRIPFYDEKLEGKDYMTEEQVYDLFDGTVVITEKIDGSAQYEVTPEGIGVYYEDIKYKHTILYNNLPEYFMKTKYQVLLGYEYNGNICRYNDYSAPILFEGKIHNDLVKTWLKMLMKLKSQWSDDLVEGIVVANYDKQLFGKISRFDISGEIDIHWSKNKVRNYSQDIGDKTK